MADPEDLVPTLLREMRRDIAGRFDQVDKQFGDVRADLAEQNRKLEIMRQALKAETLFARYAALGVGRSP